MGIYNISLGNGIIIPSKMLVKMYPDHFNNVEEYGPEELEDILRKVTGKKFKVSNVGHDAFKSRNGSMQVLSGTKNYDIVKEIKKLDNEYKDLEVGSDLLSCGTLIFIGFYEEMGNSEFEYYPKTAEVIYGLPAILEDIITILPTLKEKDCSLLTEMFKQEACIWTFANDCACCG